MSNGFTLYQLEWSDRHPEFPWSSTKEKCQPSWNTMPRIKRSQYLERAEAEGLKDLENRVNDKKEKEADLISCLMKQQKDENEKVLQWIKRSLKKSQIWIFLSVTCFSNQALDCPGELAMAKFSMEKGVEETLHMFINPGSLPKGSTAEAQIVANETHKMTLPPCEGESDFNVIYEKIIQFFGKEDSVAIFVHPMKATEFKAAKMTMGRIFSNVAKESQPIVVELADLVSKMGSTDLAKARDILDNSFTNLKHGCDFHSKPEIDSIYHCCLSKVCRWAEVISQLQPNLPDDFREKSNEDNNSDNYEYYQDKELFDAMLTCEDPSSTNPFKNGLHLQQNEKCNYSFDSAA